MAVELRVIDWNLNGQSDTAAQWRLIERLGWDVLLLQEVRPKHFDDFATRAGVSGADFALRQELASALA